MNPIKLFEVLSTLIVVPSDTDPTKAPEVIGATIQANATIIAAIVGAIATIMGALLTVIIPLFIKEKEKTKTLGNRIKSLENLVSNLKQDLQEFSEAIADSKLKNTLVETINSFNVQLVEISKDPRVWENAYIWLKREQSNLLKKALNNIFEKHPDLKKPGMLLDSKEQRKKFELSIDDRLDWIRMSLKRKTTIPIEVMKSGATPLISEPTAYLEVYNSIKQQIKVTIENGSSSLSSDGAEVLQNFINYLVHEKTL